MKTCKRCNEEKSVDDFYLNTNSETRRSICKKCYVDNNKKTNSVNNPKRVNYTEDGELLFTLYYIPQHHYVGCCVKKPHYRMLDHSHKGKNTEGWEIIHQSTDLKEISDMEELLHSTGYNGKGSISFERSVKIHYSHLFTSKINK